MRVLLIGSGAREHALATSLVADPAVTDLHAAPGNPGIAELATVHPVDLADVDALAGLAVDLSADLVVVGPEAPLVAGAADAVRAKGVACFGPSAEAARLEGSKDFAKSVMAAAGVPTARSRTCATPDEVAAALDEFGAPYVVKDDGLAAGKGVLVTADRSAALAHAGACLAVRRPDGARVVVEEFLSGPEASLFVVTDGTTAVPLLPAQDFKRIGDGDTGPNTGGMGAYAPLPWAPPDLADRVLAEIVEPTLAEMRRRGTPFAGLLYVGLALTPGAAPAGGPAADRATRPAPGGIVPKVIEFNCRFGDPETQPVLALLETPLGGLLHGAATGRLAGHPPLCWRPGAAVSVVLASAGYPGTPRTGDVIEGARRPGILHAGTAVRADGALVSAGGRVLCATATGETVPAARHAAYELLSGVRLAGGQHRTDIAALG